MVVIDPILGIVKGDLGVRDGRGYFIFEGRLKETLRISHAALRSFGIAQPRLAGEAHEVGIGVQALHQGGEGQGLWQHVPESDWQDWTWQLKNRITTVEQLERQMTLTPAERAGCLFANRKLALAITPYFFNLIDRSDPHCPIRKQVIPRSDEMVLSSGEMLRHGVTAMMTSSAPR